MIESVCKPQSVIQGIKRVMIWIHQQRHRYVDAHPASFPTAREKAYYLSDWVANYELSDWLHSQRASHQNVHFVRLCERGSVKHEELWYVLFSVKETLLPY
eukprot:gnl/Hemi2/8889_TR3073_c0_g1_i1.p1 gnl/Hemi2/8889_TR3073_c0_g1~~gnl/Hemi2/8889_TR3073_c0_g1_i1.p1  ORF type:complete len:101 (+),score=3.45 gnl/Hemi2/8889_TR3073_c0_g1_i1:317-619(+)